VDSCARGGHGGNSGDESEDSPPNNNAASTLLPIGKVIGPKNGGRSNSPGNNNVGSSNAVLGNNGVGIGNNSGASIVVHHGEPSIVERNARVIKWLFNCRKATDHQTTCKGPSR
jgi:hypothetical protein